MRMRRWQSGTSRRNWIAAGTAVASVALGTVALLNPAGPSSGPGRASTGMMVEPDVTTSLSVVLILTPMLTIGLSTLIARSGQAGGRLLATHLVERAP